MTVIGSLKNRRFSTPSARSAPESVNTVEVPRPSAPVDLVYLNDLTPQPVEWLWQHRLAAGTLALPTGEPGAGKTFLALAITAGEWLCQFLQQRSRSQNNVETAAHRDGVCIATLKRAKLNIGAVSQKGGTNGFWYWSLPAEIVAEVDQ